MDILKEVIGIYIERKDWFLELLGQHVVLSLIAIMLAGTIGLLIGVFISEHDRLAPVVLGIANVFYTIPSISLFGILIPIMGIGDKTAVTALTIYGIMPMVRNTYAGIKNVSDDVIMAARGMGSTDLQIMTKIKLPLALGIIIAGVRNMVVMTISVTAIASFIGAGGLGVSIYRGITMYNPALTLAGSLLIAAMALLSDLLLGKIENHMKKRGTY
ncbi:MAG: ABC transporter permease [Lachnospiraceae bacterium]|nr:ABC transporter permease [Lachnospiraceae bacterium]